MMAVSFTADFPGDAANDSADEARLPDAEQVRRRALVRSWRRDRAVARWRLAWRWLHWAVPRLVLPALLLAGLALWEGALVPPPAASHEASQPMRAVHGQASSVDTLELRPSLELAAPPAERPEAQ